MRPTVISTTSVIDRRTFLHVMGVLSAGGVLTACSSEGAQVSEASSPAASAEADPGARAVAAIAPDAEVSLAVVAATFEQLVNQPNPFVFGLFTLEQEPIEGASAEVWAVPSDGDPVGPWPATPADADVPPGGLYIVDPSFPGTGLHEVVVVTDDNRAGSVAVDVRDAASSQLAAPGQQAQAVATPTKADPLGYDTLCTRAEPCGMHEVSLDDALLAERPIALLFATPAFCQTAVCGPTVDVVDQVRRDVDGVQFIHCEIFSDEGSTLGDPVQAWNLPTEPWLFVIDAEGRIVSRADGPLLTLADQVRSLLDDGLSA